MGRSRRAVLGAVPSSEDIAEKAKLPVVWGDPLLQGLHAGFLVALVGPRRLLAHAEPDDARLRGARGRPQPGGGALRRHQRRPELLPGDGDRRALRRTRRRPRRPRLAVPARHHPDPGLEDRLHRHRRRAARPEHGGRRRRSPRSSSPRSRRAPRPGTSIPSSSRPISRRASPIIIQGLIVLFVGADLIILLALRRLQAHASARRARRESASARLARGRLGRRRASGLPRRSSRCPRCRCARPVAPIVIGLFALTIGIGSWIRGERRIGGYAIGGRRPRVSSSATSRPARASRTSKPSSSGARCSRPCSAMRRRSSSPRSVACSRSARASSTSGSRG